MKKLNLAIVFLLISNFAIAQHSEKELEKHAKKIAKSANKGIGLESLDTFFNNGLPVCHYIVTKRQLGRDMNFEFVSFKDSQTLISGQITSIGVSPSTVWYKDLNFLAQNHKLRLADSENIYRLLGKYNVMNDSAINVENLNRMLLEKGQPTVVSTGATAAASSSNQNGSNAARNRNGMIMIMGKEIKQSNVTIGTITQSTKAENGGIFKTISIFNNNGTLCATATNGGINNYNWTIITSKDNKSHSTTSSIGKDEQDVVKLLVDNLYL